MTKLHPSLKKFDAILRSIVSTQPPDLIRVWIETHSRRRRRHTNPKVRQMPEALPAEEAAPDDLRSAR